MNNSNELLLLSLKDFYSNENNVSILLSIINSQSNISLRLIDWFITNYCKNTKDKTSNKNITSIYQNYRAQLKAYKKTKFDPFRRRQRITFFYNDKEFMNTTIGQLNFFKWAIENKILDYISSRLEELEELMNGYQKTIKKQKETKSIDLHKKSNVDDLNVNVNVDVKSSKYHLKILSNITTTVNFD
jgi:replicative superfamily II helicase